MLIIIITTAVPIKIRHQRMDLARAGGTTNTSDSGESPNIRSAAAKFPPRNSRHA